ncbi:hypothetical protein LY76DRAFT_437797 [Colletotrichum caudatum]|nr:hypothetical protein LY76DRAFT_437797 [Colletotrichum caudatum]
MVAGKSLPGTYFFYHILSLCMLRKDPMGKGSRRKPLSPLPHSGQGPWETKGKVPFGFLRACLLFPFLIFFLLLLSFHQPFDS